MQLPKIVAALLAAATLSAQAGTIFSEGFEDVASLTSQGWGIWNLSQEPYGEGWFQGAAVPFSAAAGSDSSYAAANYLGTVRGNLSIWLVTPEIQLTGDDILNFSVRAVGEYPWADSLRVRIADGSANAPDQFGTPIFDMTAVPAAWIDIHPHLPESTTSVRIAFEYYGTFTTSNYLGLDSVSVTSAVPEPAAALLFGMGLAGITLQRRRAAVVQVITMDAIDRPATVANSAAT